MEITKTKHKIIIFVAAVCTAIIGVLFYNVMPIFLGTLQDSVGLSTSEIGFVASIFFLGFNLSSASAYFWVRKIKIRKLTVIAIVLMAAVLWLSTYINNASAILAISAVIGALSGSLAAIAATIIGDSAKPKLWYGVKVAAESVAGVLLLSILPMTLIPKYGFKGVVIGMVATIIVLLPFVFFLMRGNLEHSGENPLPTQSISSTGTAKQSTWPVWCSILAMLFLFLGASAVWAFEERIAVIFEFDAVWVGRILGLSLVFAVIGPLIAGVAGTRFGIKIPFTVASLLTIVGVIAIAISNMSTSYYAIGACLFMLGWSAGYALVFSKVAINDPNGRFVTLTITAIGIGSMIGPALAGMLLSGGSVQSVKWLAIIAVTVSLLGIWVADGND